MQSLDGGKMHREAASVPSSFDLPKRLGRRGDRPDHRPALHLTAVPAAKPETAGFAFVCSAFELHAPANPPWASSRRSVRKADTGAAQSQARSPASDA